jgi:N6-adenosine-specific RNA methylase IME4
MIINGDITHPDFLTWFGGQTFSHLVVDNPLHYNDQRKERKDGGGATRGIGCCHHYGTLTDEQLAALPIQELAAEKCLVHLWITGPKLDVGFDLLKAWGLEYATIEFIWVKTYPERWKQYSQPQLITSAAEALKQLTVFGPGFYTASNAELVLVGRTEAIRHNEGRKASQIIYAPRGEHSQKPEEMQDLLDWLYPGWPRLELFARRPRPNWWCFGNELGQWAKPEKNYLTNAASNVYTDNDAGLSFVQWRASATWGRHPRAHAQRCVFLFWCTMLF